MAYYTHETAPTQFVRAGDTRFAYRRFGERGQLPLLLLNYFAANMDDWDPMVTNGLAVDREVILFDNTGVGGSVGETPKTVTAMTKDLIRLCRALEVETLDVLGFSLGGMIAQQLVVDEPGLVRRMILLSTGPRGGEGLTFTDLSIEELKDPVALTMKAFFTASPRSVTAGHAYLDRLKLRTADRDATVSQESAAAQLTAIREWGTVPETGRYSTLNDIHQPVLIVHGNNDVVVSPINAFILEQHLPDAQLLMLPDASHGAYSQHATVFLPHALQFLND